MPQMAPLNWLSLTLFFIMTLVMFNINNYFMFKYTPVKTLHNAMKNKTTWKW